ncbi:MAG: hypothetical protein KAR38_09865, partial [Calditrichia bacterium]|nr:hypothetical protein [Calditrichia bacterium]
TEWNIPGLSVTLFEEIGNNFNMKIGIKGNAFSMEFSCIIRPQNTPMEIQNAILSCQSMQSQPSCIIVPYLSEEQLNNLTVAGISGIDLCGNMVITIPGKLFIYRTGKPNLYKSSNPIKNVYRGKSALVSYAFLLQNTFSSINEIVKFIRSKGYSITQGTTSKVVKVLEEDLIVNKTSKISLIQPEKLLQNLSINFSMPVTKGILKGKLKIKLSEFLKRINIDKNQSVLSGISSAPKYSGYINNMPQIIYISNLDFVKKSGLVEEDNRFYDIEIWEIEDDKLLFDICFKEDIYLASPILTYLELMTMDKREKETAAEIAAKLIIKTIKR